MEPGGLFIGAAGEVESIYGPRIATVFAYGALCVGVAWDVFRGRHHVSM